MPLFFGKDFEIVNESTELSIGDDAAILDYKNQKSIVTTDMLVEGVHFDLSYFPLKHLGYKAVVSSISDICAMYGIIKQITCLLYTSPSPRDRQKSRMPSSA